jgi:hypothetical protein
MQVPLAVPAVMVQLIPAGLLPTVPLPVPPPETTSGYRFTLKRTVTLLGCVMLTVQMSVPVQSPDQPANV